MKYAYRNEEIKKGCNAEKQKRKTVETPRWKLIK